MTKKRTHNPNWKDNTRNQRQNNRNAILNARAIEFGFNGWSEMMTAIKNNKAIVVKVESPNP